MLTGQNQGTYPFHRAEQRFIRKRGRQTGLHPENGAGSDF
ncbi:hypothetical protein RGAI101_3704 [Roseobacter sp. GAI101]|nr:hypothetical protein RGAI101_3704 [Roseobacter sp. GAI101]